MNIWIHTLISVLFVSMISLIGAFLLSIKSIQLKKIVLFLISFSAGALIGDVFIHMLPEIIAQSKFTIATSWYILSGILLSFIMEKIIAWRHCHLPIEKNHVHRFAYMNLIGDSIHNFIDGVIIGASYLVNIPLGISTTIAIALHEIPQEIGDFGVLIHGGFGIKKAMIYNFLTALTAVFGAVVTLLLHLSITSSTQIILPIAAGTFIYISGSDLIPELHKDTNIRNGIFQISAFILGIGIMSLLLLLD